MSAMISTILFATDMGPQTPYLLHHVNSLALQQRASVQVVHAIEPPGHIGDALFSAYVPSDSRQELESEGLERIIAGVRCSIVDMLEQAFMDGDHGLSKIRQVQVVAGKPVQVILDCAVDCGADMLILGSRGEGAPAAMLGSVTSRVLQLSRIPVYMVPLARDLS